VAGLILLDDKKNFFIFFIFYFSPPVKQPATPATPATFTLSILYFSIKRSGGLDGGLSVGWRVVYIYSSYSIKHPSLNLS